MEYNEESELSEKINVTKNTSEKWRQHIFRQLQNRDKCQKTMFQELIRSYINLMERSYQRAFITKGILGCGLRYPAASKSYPTSLILMNDDLKKTTGELAFHTVELHREIKIKEFELEEQHARASKLQKQLVGVQAEYKDLKFRVAEVHEGNLVLKREYDSLLQRHRRLEQTYQKENVRGSELVEDMICRKQVAAVRMNSRNERRVRAREANLQKELESATKMKVTIDIGCVFAPPSEITSSEHNIADTFERRHVRLFRSASANLTTSPWILDSIKELFEKKRRDNSVCNPEEHFYAPKGICLVAKVPTKALHVLDAHELGINAVQFSSTSNLLATGGTDRVIKLWDVKAGMLHNKGTLGGSNEGITSIEFDPTGNRILAASYDKSALYWRLDDQVPKLTLTGHSRKVTAAKFKCSMHHVVTGSADRTIKVWDLHRAACIQTIEVLSYCSDVLCSEHFIISGHYDRKIRLWDSRSASCLQELPLQGKVTSLDLSPDHRQLLSCSRDDCLQVVDLRMNNTRICYRAEGFKCGSDSTKAIFSPDGSFLAVGSVDGAVYIWNVSTGNLETRLPDIHSSSVNAVSWSVSGDFVVSVDKSRRAVLWSDI